MFAAYHRRIMILKSQEDYCLSRREDDKTWIVIISTISKRKIKYAGNNSVSMTKLLPALFYFSIILTQRLFSKIFLYRGLRF